MPLRLQLMYDWSLDSKTLCLTSNIVCWLTSILGLLTLTSLLMKVDPLCYLRCKHYVYQRYQTFYVVSFVTSSNS